MESGNHDPSDAGAPPPTPVPPELLAEILKSFNEAEILEEIRAGRWRTFDQFIGELEALAQQAGDSTANRG